MSLRVKVELALFLTFALVIGLSYGIQRFVIIPGLSPVERAGAAREMYRCVEALERQGEIIHALSTEWAILPTVSAALERGADVSGDPPLSTSQIEKAGLSGVFLLSPERHLKWSYLGVDETGTPLQLPTLSRERWPEEMALFKTEQASYLGSGIYLTKRGPSLICVAPVGERGGMLVLCRLLDRDLLNQLY
ncbi:MAG: hypothetical protein L3K26_07790, partial [Candidatus Hydrogenedentes bacterium]|nr:hypothetical protein [Candidatus Hydrogenedentota bacterium]